MTSAKYERIWQLLNEYQFKFNAQLNIDYMCTICQGILRNPYQSPCGCRYCMKCIVDYLDGGEKYCPGGVDECREQTIQFERDLHIDYVINKKISHISVKCPMELCGFSDELRNIEEHISTHNTKCPYQSIGCGKRLGDGKSLNDHLNKAVYEHATLLMETVGSLTRQVASLKKSLEASKKDSLEKDELLADMEERLEQMRIHQSNEMNNLKDRLRKFEMGGANERDRLATSAQSNNGGPVIATEQAILGATGSLYYDPMASYLSPTGLVARKVPAHPSASPRYAPFTWKITTFKRHRKDAKKDSNWYLTSDAFYSGFRGYKLCLTAYPNGAGTGRSSHLSVFMHIMNGEFDDELPWPMMLEARICLVNQSFQNLCVDKSFSYNSFLPRDRYKFDKPLAFRNAGIGDPRFSELAVMLDNDKIYQRDSIVIRCYINK